MLYATIPIVDNVNANITDLGSYSSNIVGLILSLAGMATFIYMAYGGVMWITASGDKGKIEDARNKITNAIIGLAIVASSWAIFLVLNHFFGLGIAGGVGSNSGSGSGGNGSSSSTKCSGGLKVGETGEGPGGVMYKCVPAGSPCAGTVKSYDFPFNCPI
jgi:hypothetical protein